MCRHIVANCEYNRPPCTRNLGEEYHAIAEKPAGEQSVKMSVTRQYALTPPLLASAENRMNLEAWVTPRLV